MQINNQPYNYPQLTWSAPDTESDGPQVAYYEVFRTIGDQTQMIAQITAPTTTFTDQTAPTGVNLTYSIEAVDTLGNTSVASESQTITVTQAANVITDNVLLAPDQYIPSDDETYLNNTLEDAVRQRAVVIPGLDLQTTIAPARGWFDPSIDQIINTGANTTWTFGTDTDYDNTNNTEYYNSLDVSSAFNKSFDGYIHPEGVTVLYQASGGSAWASGDNTILQNPYLIRGTEGSFSYYDLNADGHWDPGDPIWFNSQSGITWYVSGDPTIYNPNNVTLTTGMNGKTEGLESYAPTGSNQWSQDLVWIDQTKSVGSTAAPQSYPVNEHSAYMSDLGGLQETIARLLPDFASNDALYTPLSLYAALQTTGAQPMSVSDLTITSNWPNGSTVTITAAAQTMAAIKGADLCVTGTDGQQIILQPDSFAGGTTYNILGTQTASAVLSASSGHALNWTLLPSNDAQLQQLGVTPSTLMGDVSNYVTDTNATPLFVEQLNEIANVVNLMQQPAASKWNIASYTNSNMSNDAVAVETYQEALDDFNAAIASQPADANDGSDGSGPVVFGVDPGQPISRDALFAPGNTPGTSPGVGKEIELLANQIIVANQNGPVKPGNGAPYQYLSDADPTTFSNVSDLESSPSIPPTLQTFFDTAVTEITANGLWIHTSNQPIVNTPGIIQIYSYYKGTWYDANIDDATDYALELDTNPQDIGTDLIYSPPSSTYSATFNPVDQAPSDVIPLDSEMDYLNDVTDSPLDGIVQVAQDQTSFGNDTGSMLFDPTRSDPQVYLPLFTDNNQPLPINAYFVQGGFEGTNGALLDQWNTYADANQQGLPYAYSLDTHVQVNLLINMPDAHVKHVEVTRPDGDSVVFDFAWDDTTQSFSDLGYPMGINSRQLYVIRDLSGDNGADLSSPYANGTDGVGMAYALEFPSGIVQTFSSAGSANPAIAYLTRISDSTGKVDDVLDNTTGHQDVYFPIGNGPTQAMPVLLNDESAFGSAGNAANPVNRLETGRYDITTNWLDGQISSIDYQTTDGAQTIITTLGYSQGIPSANNGATITSLTKGYNSPSDEINAFSYSYNEGGNSIDHDGIETSRSNDGNIGTNGGDVTLTTTTSSDQYQTTEFDYNPDVLLTQTTVTLYNGDYTAAPAVTTYTYDSSTSRCSLNGAPQWGELTNVTNPDGSWTDYTYYDDTGWLQETITPFQGAQANQDDQDQNVTIYNYNTDPIYNADEAMSAYESDVAEVPGLTSDPIALTAQPNLVVTCLQGIETGRNYFEYTPNANAASTWLYPWYPYMFNNEGGDVVVSRQATNPGDSWNDSAAMQTITAPNLFGLANVVSTTGSTSYVLVTGSANFNGNFGQGTDFLQRDYSVDGRLNDTIETQTNAFGNVLLSTTYTVDTSNAPASYETVGFHASADSFGRITSSLDDVNGTSTTYTYDINAADSWLGPTTIKNPDTSVTNLAYTPSGQVLTSSTLGITTTYAYDAAGNVINTSTQGTFDNQPSASQSSSSVYDSDERLVSSTDGDQNTTTYSYQLGTSGTNTTYITTTTAPNSGVTTETDYIDGSQDELITSGVNLPTYYFSGEETYTPSGDSSAPDFIVSDVPTGGTWDETVVGNQATQTFYNSDGNAYKTIQFSTTNSATVIQNATVTTFDELGRPQATMTYNGTILNGVSITDYSGDNGSADDTITLSSLADFTGLANFFNSGVQSAENDGTDQEVLTNSFVTNSTNTVGGIALGFIFNTQTISTGNSGAEPTVSVADQTLNGLKSWNVSGILANFDITNGDLYYDPNFDTSQPAQFTSSSQYGTTDNHTVVVTNPDGSIEIDQYQNGQLNKQTDEAANGANPVTTSYGYNGLGEQNSDTNAATGKTTYTLDGNGNVTQTSDAQGQSSTVYDADGNVTQQTLLGNNTGSETINMTYNAADQMTGQSGGGSIAVGYGYDTLGNMNSITTYGTATDTTQYSYDPTTNLLQYTQYADGPSD